MNKKLVGLVLAGVLVVSSGANVFANKPQGNQGGNQQQEQKVEKTGVIGHVDVRMSKSILVVRNYTIVKTTKADGTVETIYKAKDINGQEIQGATYEEIRDKIQVEQVNVDVKNVDKVVLKNGEEVELTKFTTRQDGNEMEFHADLLEELNVNNLHTATFQADFQDEKGNVYNDVVFTVEKSAINGAYNLCPGTSDKDKGLDFRFEFSETSNGMVVEKDDKPELPTDPTPDPEEPKDEVVEEEGNEVVDVPTTGDISKLPYGLGAIAALTGLLVVNRKNKRK